MTRKLCDSNSNIIIRTVPHPHAHEINRITKHRYASNGILMRACEEPVGGRGEMGHMHDFDLRVDVLGLGAKSCNWIIHFTRTDRKMDPSREVLTCHVFRGT